MTGQIKTITKTITFGSWIHESQPNDNHGGDTTLYVWRTTAQGRRRAILRLDMPDEPIGVGPIKSVKLHIRIQTCTNPPIITKIAKLDKNPLENSVTWNSYDGANLWTTVGGDFSDALSEDVEIVATGWFEWDISDYFIGHNISWGDNLYVLIHTTTINATKALIIYSDDESAPFQPYLEIEYYDDEPTKIVDLKANPSPHDERLVKLTWSQNEDGDFVKYKIYRSTSSPVTVSDTQLGSDITNQAIEEYTETVIEKTNEDTTYYYAIFVEDASNTGANATKSNEIDVKRPKVSTFNIRNVNEGNTTFFIWEKVYAEIWGKGGKDGIVGVEKLFVDWGDGSRAWADFKQTKLTDDASASGLSLTVEDTSLFEADDIIIIWDGTNGESLGVDAKPHIVDRVDTNKVYFKTGNGLVHSYLEATPTYVYKARTYFYHKTGTFAALSKIEDNYNFHSDLKSPTSEPNPKTRTPTVMLKASPINQKTNTDINLSWFESFVRDMAKTISEFMLDKGGGSGFESQGISLKTTTNYSSTGTKKVRLYAKDDTATKNLGIQIEKVIYYDQSLGTYTDDTEDVADEGTDDVAIGDDDSDIIYFGCYKKFSQLEFDLSTMGSGGSPVYVWEYWDGSAWQTLTVSDGTSDFTQDDTVEFTPPSDWFADNLNDIVASSKETDDLYWVRLKWTTAYSTPPLATTILPFGEDLGNYIEVEISTETIVNLDTALDDGYSAIDDEEGKNIVALEGLFDGGSIYTTAVKIRKITLGGEASTGCDDDNDVPPDDITTIRDAINNNKTAQITLEGSTKKGILANLRKSRKGGWKDRWYWTCDMFITD